MKTKLGSGKQVLLIEDFQIDIDATLPLLGTVGYQKKAIHVSETIEDAVQFLKKATPELVILDLEVPQHTGAIRSLNSGLDFLRKLVAEYDNRLRVIVYSRYPHLWVAFQVVSLGVSFIAKQDHNKEFFSAALKQIKQGHLIVSSSVLPNLKQMFRSALRVGLEEDDRQILRYILTGATDRDIAKELGYGEDWVSGRLRRMFKSFGFNNREDLAAWFRDYVAPVLGIDIAIQKK